MARTITAKCSDSVPVQSRDETAHTFGGGETPGRGADFGGQGGGGEATTLDE